MSAKANALLVHGGLITKYTAAELVRWFTEREHDYDPETVLMIELPPGVKYKVVEFDPEKVIESLEIVEES
jgi:hypothetical protein